MPDAIPTSELLDRLEQVIRDNERLQRRVNELEPAIGHTVILVRLADSVRAWRRDQSAEGLERMYAAVDEFFSTHGRKGASSPRRQAATET